MKLFERKKIKFDEKSEIPAIRSSICTGEKTAGFLNKSSGKFREFCLIQNEKDLSDFMKKCEVSEIKQIF